jgi:hypothetical protein
MAGHFFVTYDIVTPESAEQGDAAESGFASPGGWHHDDRPEPVTLKEALRIVGYGGRPACGAFDDGGWGFYATDRDQDYRTGEETSYAIHPAITITPASYRRVRRLLGCR